MHSAVVNLSRKAPKAYLQIRRLHAVPNPQVDFAVQKAKHAFESYRKVTITFMLAFNPSGSFDKS